VIRELEETRIHFQHHATGTFGKQSVRNTFLSIGALLAATALMYFGAGQQGILVPVRAGLEGFSDLTVGLFGTAYALGFVAGCYLVPVSLRRVGHIRTFAVMASLAAAGILMHGLVVWPEIWFPLRFVAGFSIAGAAMIIESWLNARSSNENRGGVFSVYMVVYLISVTSGQLSLVAFDPLMLTMFAVSAIMFTFALIPTSLTRMDAPEVPARVELDIRGLYRLSPVGAMGALAVGMANGSFGTLGPIYAQDTGFTTAGVAVFMSVALIAGAISQWPFGRWSDYVDRRLVIGSVGTVGAIAGLLLVLFAAPGFSGYALVGLFGIAAYSLYGLSVAHANDHADPADFVTVSGGLLVLFGIGSAVGPLVTALLSLLLTSTAVFVFTALMHASLAAFAFYRIGRRKPVAEEEKESFVGFARPTSPEAAVLDPRGEDAADLPDDADQPATP